MMHSTVRAIAVSPGVSLVIEEFGRPSASTVVLLAHAAGFCRQVWNPVLQLLPEGLHKDVRFVSFDARAHGDSALLAPRSNEWKLPPNALDFWLTQCDDVLAIVRELGIACNRGRRLVGVGHGCGTLSLSLAQRKGVQEGQETQARWHASPEARDPFSSLVLCEPIDISTEVVAGEPGACVRQFASTRPHVFASAASAQASLKAVPAFASWDERVMAAYCEGAIFRHADDGLFHLKCTPWDELDYYNFGNLRYFRAIGSWSPLAAREGIAILTGETSASIWIGHFGLLEFFCDGLAFHGRVRKAVVPGASHFFPMERPDVVAAYIALAVRGRLATS